MDIIERFGGDVVKFAGIILYLDKYVFNELCICLLFIPISISWFDFILIIPIILGDALYVIWRTKINTIDYHNESNKEFLKLSQLSIRMAVSCN